jgi:hypothetical protein
MPERASIAVACVLHAERATVTEWLSQSGYEPVAIADLALLEESLQSKPIEALIADSALIPRENDVCGLMRRLGSNRPLVMLGDTRGLPGTVLNDLNVIARPVTRDALLLSVGLALAEGRPARRYPRRTVEPIPGTAHGVAVTIFEASVGGVGLELIGHRPSVLPPFFNLRVPEFGVHVVVKRAWMAPAGRDLLRCGGTIESDLPSAKRSWAEFAREAPAPVSAVARRLAIAVPREIA